MRDIKLIALDLDGTLLNSKKKLSSANLLALERAAEMGIEIVPTTGRFFNAMPEFIRALPFVHYAVTINGAQVYDIANDRAVYKSEIPMQKAVDIMSYLDTLPVIYDCYMENGGRMTRRLWEISSEYAPDEHYRKMLHDLREPVPELKEYILERGADVQKIQLFMKDAALRAELLSTLGDRFEDIAVSSSVVNNVEINDSHANKGEAIERLCEYLGINIEQTLAFGDGLNDLSMIEKCGIGAAMGNAVPEVKAAADMTVPSCDSDGVAAGIALITEQKMKRG